MALLSRLAEHADSAQLALGLSFLVLASAAAGLRRSAGLRLPWGWIAIFSLIQGFQVWECLAANTFEGSIAWWIQGTLAAGALATLLEAVRAATCVKRLPARGLWIHAATPVHILAIALLAAREAIGEAGADALLLNAWAPLMLLLMFRALRTPRDQAANDLKIVRSALRFMAAAAAFAIIDLLLRFFSHEDGSGVSQQARADLVILVLAQASLLILAALQLRKELFSIFDHVQRNWFGRVDWGALALLTVLALGWILTAQIGKAGKVKLHNEAANTTRLLEEQIESRCHESERAVASLAAAPTIVNAMSAGSPQDLAKADELLDRYKRSWGFSICYLLDANGRGLLATNRGTPQSNVGVDYRFRPFWQQSMRGEPARYMALGLTTNERGFFASAPVRDASDTIRGVAVIKRNLDELEEAFLPYGRVYLVSPEGVIFLSGQKTDALHALWPIAQEHLPRMAASRQFGSAPLDPILPHRIDNGQYFTLHHRPYALIQHVIDNAGWSVVCFAPAQLVAKYRLTGIGLGGFLCLLVLAFTWISEQGRISDALLNVVDRRFRHILESSRLAAVTLDSAGRITFCNDYLLGITHWTRDELIGKDWFHTFRVGDSADRDEFLKSLSTGGFPGFAECIIKTRHGDQRIFRWNRTIMRDVRGHVIGLSSLGEDVTEQKAMEEQLHAAARTDRLTGLANRTALLDRLQQTILRRHRSNDAHYAVLFLDFDRFKLINDSLGHNAGDQLLTQIASRLRSSVRSLDSVCRDDANVAARLGGDEFVILLEGIRAETDARAVAERILTLLSEPFTIAEHQIVSTASIGIVTSQMPADCAEDVLRDADTAMYEAKAAGRGRYVLFDQTMRQRVQQRLTIENDLRRALDLDQLSLLYQPIVSLENGQTESVEALVRWTHPQHGLVSPAQFVPIAEESGLILPIGKWILTQACRQYRAWASLNHPQLPAGISINLSRTQLSMPDLPAVVAQVLEETGIDPSRVHLEITESAVMRNQDAAIQTLRQLKALGVKLDLDDFGTGYSSLSSLHLFPLDVIKIDRSFIANLSRGRDFAALVHAVTQLARNLGISVVAEGIETADQLQMLQALDCRLGQGFLFSPPLPADQALDFRMDLAPLARTAA